jgi:hypothetical protein
MKCNKIVKNPQSNTKTMSRHLKKCQQKQQITISTQGEAKQRPMESFLLKNNIKLSNHEKQLLYQECTKFICMGNQSFNIVEGDGFEGIAYYFIKMGFNKYY